jgi:hypothetical protein
MLKRLNFILTDEDLDIQEWIKLKGGLSDYIRQLIRQDITRNKTNNLQDIYTNTQHIIELLKNLPNKLKFG